MFQQLDDHLFFSLVPQVGKVRKVYMNKEKVLMSNLQRISPKVAASHLSL